MSASSSASPGTGGIAFRLRRRVVTKDWKSTPMLALSVRGPYKGASGHDHHVREFVRHLAARGVAVRLVDVPQWSPVKLAPDQRDPWFDTLGAPVEARTVLHFCMPHQVRSTPGLLNVNYTMFEATRIPASWVACNL